LVATFVTPNFHRHVILSEAKNLSQGGWNIREKRVSRASTARFLGRRGDRGDLGMTILGMIAEFWMVCIMPHA
jgi:hypothetical protein